MIRTWLAAALAAGLTQTASGAQTPPNLPLLNEPLRSSVPVPGVEVEQFGLSSPLSPDARRQLGAGARIPVIVMMTEPKATGPGSAFGPRGLATERALDVRISQIRGERERVLMTAFGANGFTRADAADGQVAVRDAPGGPPDARALRPTVTRLFTATPGFVLLADASEINRLRTVEGVTGLYEDRAEPLLLQDSTTLVGADTLWSQNVEGAGYAVAILDSGVEAEHPMTSAAITASACFNQIVSGVSTSNCPGGVSQVTSLSSAGAGDSCVEAVLDPANGTDGCFHGTHVGSTAAGRTTTLSSGPISGVARGADIIAVNVFARFPASQCGAGATAPCIQSWTSDQISALDWLYANRNGLNLTAINMSLGGGQNFSACDSSDPRTSVINNLRAAGIATVIASGNNGFTNSVSTPACISSAITVGATTKSDAVASYSNASSLIDLLAPGSAITAAWQSEEPAPGQNCIAAGTPRAPGPDGFCHWYSGSSGTSMATPHVAGAFALLRSAFPSASVTDIEQALESTGVSVLDSRNGQSYPRIQVDAAYTALAGGGPLTPANNDFANRISLSGSSLSTTGDSTNADKEAGEPNHTSAGGASVWWSWTASSGGRVTITTFGSNFDTMLGVYTGSSVNGLSPVVRNDDAGGGLQSRVRFFPNPGQTYQIAVDGYNGATGDITLTLNQ